LSAGAIDEARGGDHDPAVLFDDVDGLHESASAGDDVFDDDETFAGLDLETAAHDERAIVVFFGENVRLTQLARDFLSDNDAAEGGGDDGVAFDVAELRGESGADLLGDLGVTQEEGALEKLAAVQAGAEDEVSVEKRAGLAEEVEEFGLGHGKSGSGSDAVVGLG
jgi:hypothetical protein